MKAELTKDFVLIVTPETAVESIALAAWSDKYHVISSESNEPQESPAATLLIKRAVEDLLYKTAKAILDYRDSTEQPVSWMMFSYDELQVCRQIVAEGEGNPHPWPERNPAQSK